MRHFSHLDEQTLDEAFEVRPVPFSLSAAPMTIGLALGATLYMPGTRPHLVADVARCRAAGVMSVVLCLEDAIRDQDVPAGERNIVQAGQELAATSRDDQAPLLFIRVRSPAQLVDVADRLGPAMRRFSGFVLPKFTARSGSAVFEALAKVESQAGVPLFAMPVLESPEIMYEETRRQALRDVASLLDENRSRVLSVRLGAADLSGLYGLRRTLGVSVYEVGVLRDVIADVVNVLGRADGSGHVIAGPVWEHFATSDRLFKPRLRTTPFEDDLPAKRLRQQLIHADHDELLREVVLDKANGLIGKTVIHPSHVGPVHALLVVSHEELSDAETVMAATDGGADGSVYRNKMNEAGPHRAWARRLLERAELFGVASPEHGGVGVLAALAQRPTSVS